MPSQSVSSAPTSSAASRTYRQRALAPAGIFVDKVDWSEAPQSASDLADQLLPKEELLTLALTLRMPSSLAEISNSLSETSPPKLKVALRQALKVKALDISSFSNKLENKWMRLNRVTLSLLLDDDHFGNSEDGLWTAPGGPTGQEAAPLSLPKPDLSFGLLICADESDADGPTKIGVAPLQKLWMDSRSRIISSPTLQEWEMAFPGVVFEGKSDTSSMAFAENQAALGAAKSLSILRELEAFASTPSSMPIVALTSQGALWKVFVGFTVQKRDQTQYHLRRIGRTFDISDDWDNFQLQLVVYNIHQWLYQAYCPHVKGAVEASLIKLGLAATPPNVTDSYVAQSKEDVGLDAQPRRSGRLFAARTPGQESGDEHGEGA